MDATEQDPFAIFHTPPPNETSEERADRIVREAAAQRASDDIDAQLAADRMREGYAVHVLLLGQSESGKSTVIKNFRMRYDRHAWNTERSSWCSVVQLNIVHSIITVLDALQAEQSGEAVKTVSTHPEVSCASAEAQHPIQITERHQALMMSLEPLYSVEADLRKRLGAGSEEENDNASSSEEAGMKSALEIMLTCLGSMKSLYADPTIRAVLRKRRIWIEGSAGFYLDGLDRIVRRDYQPSDDDIIRAYLPTRGVQEYQIHLPPSDISADPNLTSKDWLLYDVGGYKTQRHVWLPYFDRVHAIIFLMSVSSFDEYFFNTNRLEDSLNLWKALCSSKLLQETSFILFLNKCDLLTRKLNSGGMFKDFLPSYGERSNDTDTVVQYVRGQFGQELRHHSPSNRECYIHATSAVNTNIVSLTLYSVKQIILRDQLKYASLV